MNKFKKHQIKMFGVLPEITKNIDETKIKNLIEFENSYNEFKIGRTIRYYIKIEKENFPEFDLFNGKEYFIIIDFHSVLDDIVVASVKKYSVGYLIIDEDNYIFEKEDKTSWTLKNGEIYFNEKKIENHDISVILKKYENEIELTNNDMINLSESLGIVPLEKLLFKFFQLKYVIPFEIIHLFLLKKHKEEN